MTRPLALMACLLALAASVGACPVEGASAAPGTLLVVKPLEGAAVALGAAQWAALPAQERVQRRTVAGAASAAGVEQSVRYGGVLLRDVLEQTMSASLRARDARRLVFEAVAIDGYRAVFSWGELFNGAIGDQVLVIGAQDGQPIGVSEGPLALRSLGDVRPGPRHVRNLCAVVARVLDAP